MYQKQAEDIVRDKLQIPPEKEVQGFDYLRVLDSLRCDVKYTADGSFFFQKTQFGETVTCEMSLTTGKPATEKDAEAFIKLIS